MEKKEKNSDHYVHVSTPHDNCNHCIHVQTRTNKKKIKCLSASTSCQVHFWALTPIHAFGPHGSYELVVIFS